MRHGGNIEEISRVYKLNEENIIDFSANINPLGLCENVKNKIIRELDKIERYPDITYLNLKKSISNYENINIKNIILGNGASEVIFNISKALMPKKGLLIAPTFSEYEESLQSVDCKIDYYKLKDNFIMEPDILNAIDDNMDILFICNPNNPTGFLSEKPLLIKIVEKCEKTKTVVVIDESFLDFLEDKDNYSVINLTNKYKNLIVVKSLTKFFAFPGIRIGYGITNNEEYKNKVEKITPSWSINMVANIAVIEALEQAEYIKDSIMHISDEREFLYNNLVKIESLKVFKGEANFLFFKCNKDIDLKKTLLEKGLLIRSCEDYVNLDKRFYRVAVRTRGENIELLKALQKVL